MNGYRRRWVGAALVMAYAVASMACACRAAPPAPSKQTARHHHCCEPKDQAPAHEHSTRCPHCDGAFATLPAPPAKSGLASSPSNLILISLPTPVIFPHAIQSCPCQVVPQAPKRPLTSLLQLHCALVT